MIEAARARFAGDVDLFADSLRAWALGDRESLYAVGAGRELADGWLSIVRAAEKYLGIKR